MLKLSDEAQAYAIYPVELNSLVAHRVLRQRTGDLYASLLAATSSCVSRRWSTCWNASCADNCCGFAEGDF